MKLAAVACAAIAFAYLAPECPAKPVSHAPDDKTTLTLDRGCIVRGPRDRKRLALEFTGGSFADGGTTILAELDRRRIKAGFFFTGEFLRIAEYRPLVRRIIDGGHYLGPHSDAHPLYASWDEPPKLLMTRAQFDDDLTANMRGLEALGVTPAKAKYFIPPYEHWTPEIAHWTIARGMVLIDHSRGTKSHMDYMEDDDPKFTSASAIMQSILDHEATDPDGLNGFLLLLHIGAGPKRTRDRSSDHLGALLDELIRRGYGFSRPDELIEGR